MFRPKNAHLQSDGGSIKTAENSSDVEELNQDIAKMEANQVMLRW